MTTIITTSTNNSLVARHIAVITKATNSALMGASKALLIEEAKRQMREGTCHFLYKKRDGSVREAFGCLTKALLNKVIKGTGQVLSLGDAVTTTILKKVQAVHFVGKI